uniref:Milton domain-containing protein n=1 Tax=Ascaris lumbricoides TaxID=6252 RepID=A0A0M3HJR4_ASCLU
MTNVMWKNQHKKGLVAFNCSSTFLLSGFTFRQSAGLHVWIPRDGIRKSDRRSSSSSANGTLSKTASTDSLAGYEGPKMGEPGKPGTRDLDFSIRRLNIRRQVRVLSDGG